MAAPDFQDLYEYVQSMDYGAQDLTDIKLWINQAYRDVAGRYRWKWQEDLTDIATVASTRTVAFPTVQEIYRLQPQAAGVQEPVYLHPHEWAEDSPWRTYTTSEGQPRYYTYYEGTLVFDPIPDAVSTYQAWRRVRTTVLTGDSDEPLIPPDYRDVLAFGALAQAATRDRNLQMVSYYQDQYEGRIRKLKEFEAMSNKQTQNRVAMPSHYGGLYDR